MALEPEPQLGPILEAVINGFKSGVFTPPPGPAALLQGVMRVNGRYAGPRWVPLGQFLGVLVPLWSNS